MAKIQGFEVKSIKTFEGREGIGLNANIYYKNKRVGEAMDDESGGPMMLYMGNKSMEYKLNEVAKERSNFEIEQYADFINELVELKEREKFFNKVQKEGYEGIVILSDDPITEDMKLGKTDKVYKFLKGFNTDTIEKEDYKYKTVYKDKEDFNIK